MSGASPQIGGEPVAACGAVPALDVSSLKLGGAGNGVPTFSAEDVRGLVRTDITHRGISQAAWARENGYTPAFVCLVLNGKRHPGHRMASVFGVRVETKPRGGVRPGAGRKQRVVS